MKKTITLQVKDEKGVYLLSIVADFQSEQTLDQALSACLTQLSVRGTFFVEMNALGINLNGAKVEKGIIPNANLARQQYYNKTGS